MSTTCEATSSAAPQLQGESRTVVQQEKATAVEWAGLAVLALPTILLGLDVTLLYLALPALAADLQPSSSQALWIMDAYGFMIAGLLITMGTLGDRIGRRRLLMIGAVAFGLASLLAAYSTSPGMLIFARAALGIAGATLMPSTLALISNMFRDAGQRALAIGIWATMFALGMAAGPLVGGILLAQFWWGAAFLVALPVVATVLIAAPLLLPEYRATTREPLDLLSVALSLAAILPLVYFIKESAKSGLSLDAAAALMLGITSAIVFARRQNALSTPLLEMKLFRTPSITIALGILFVTLVGAGGAMLLVTQYLQLVKGLPPIAAGLWMGPPALMMVLAGVMAPLLSRRLRPGLIMAGSLAVSAAGYLLLALLPWMSDLALVIAGYGLVYFGLGTVAALGTDLVVGAAPPEKAGSAAAMSETVQELGVAAGIAILGSLTVAVYRGEIIRRAPADLPEAVSAALAEGLWSAMAQPDRLPQGLLNDARIAFTSGMSLAAGLSAAGILLLAVLAAFGLRSQASVDRASQGPRADRV